MSKLNVVSFAAALFVSITGCSSDGDNNADNNAQNNEGNNDTSFMCPDPGDLGGQWDPSGKLAVVTFAVPEDFMPGSDTEITPTDRSTVYSLGFDTDTGRSAYFITIMQSSADANPQQVELETKTGELFPGAGISREEVGEVTINGEVVKIFATEADDKIDYVLFPEIGGAPKRLAIVANVSATPQCMPQLRAITLKIAKSFQLAP